MAFGLSAGAVAAIGAVGGAYISSKATKSAANTQSDATNRATDINQANIDRTYRDTAPYRTAGVNALGTLQTENDAPFDASKVQLDPGYQFGLTQGQQAIDRKTAAAGGRVSGAALKAAAQYGTDYATTGYNAAYNRQNQARTDRLNRLASLAGIGQTATNTNASVGMNGTNAISNLVSNQGNASGAATLAQGNIWGNAINQVGAVATRYANTPSYPGVPYNADTTIPMQPGGGY